MNSESPDTRDSIRETAVTTSDDETVEIAVSREVAERAGIGAIRASWSRVTLSRTRLSYARGRSGSGVWIDETGETCPARDDGVACDPNPEEWYDDVLGDG